LPHMPAQRVARPAVQCDEFCRSFQKVFAARSDSFATLRSTDPSDTTSENSLKFEGAKKCVIDQTKNDSAGGGGIQCVCHWLEASAPAADTRFDDVVSRVQPLVPQDWSRHQQRQSDEATGAPVRLWSATEPGGKHDVRVYVSGEAVTLHITKWN